MHNQLFEAALGIAKPWSVQAVDFDAGRKVLTIRVNFAAGTRFPAPFIRFTTPRPSGCDISTSSSTNASWRSGRRG